ncbi:MAG: CDP-glucose 4,6-dehydratase [Flammeovirgaceae bacterium]|nr:CDP-glucose 4,6-dehydratase [Flammeovirgaceae bacterium]
MTIDQIDLLNNTYKGKKVFLTGHTGFKGSWLTFWLYNLGAKVKGYSLSPINQDELYTQMNGDNICESVIGDIRDRDKLHQEIDIFQPDFVFHLAAQPLVRLSYEIPSETFEVNAVGTANVLDGIRKLNKTCVGVMITTDKVYENKEWQYPYRETDRLGGYDPYSASKACAELIISSYRNSFFNIKTIQIHKKTIAAARAGNVIGGGDWAKDRIIPDIVNALSNRQAVTVRNPQAIRPWQHVLEPLGAYLLLGAKLTQDPIKYGEDWNFGPLADDNLDVESLVKLAIEVWGAGQYVTPTFKDQPHEAGLLKLDISKGIAELGWKPKWNAKKAIHYTINWYKGKSNGIEAKELLKRDLDAYLSEE